MNYDLLMRVALAEDLPERRLCRGDVATVVEHHPGSSLPAACEEAAGPA
jgi:Domain of unknown function (DUF4926)